jgi:hypothetical protein
LNIKKEHGFDFGISHRDNNKVLEFVNEQVNDWELLFGLHDNLENFCIPKVGQRDFYRNETLTSTMVIMPKRMQ